jgi:hypothetical protein
MNSSLASSFPIFFLAILLLARTDANPLRELAQILDCGVQVPHVVCCDIALDRARDAHLSGDLETEKILGAYLKRHCRRMHE